MNERLFSNVNWTFLQLHVYHGENVDEMMTTMMMNKNKNKNNDDDDDDDVRFVLNQQAELYFYSANSLEQQTCHSTLTHPDSDPASLFSYSRINDACLVEKQ